MMVLFTMSSTFCETHLPPEHDTVDATGLLSTVPTRRNTPDQETVFPRASWHALKW